MRTILVWILFSNCLYPIIDETDSSLFHDLLMRQQQLMQQLKLLSKDQQNYTYIQALKEVHEIYRKIGNREQTYSFYVSLLKMYKYKSLYPYLFYYISTFHQGKIRENYLLKALQSSTALRALDFCLTILYEYYKNAGIGALEFSYLNRLIDVRKKLGESKGLEQSYRDMASYYRRQQDLLSALDNDFKALQYAGKFKNNHGGYIYLDIAQIFDLINKSELAKKFLKKAIDFSTKRGDSTLKILVLSTYSQLNYRLGDYHQALKYIDLSIDTEMKSDNYTRLSESYYQKALILKKLGNSEEEIALLKVAVQLGLSQRRYQNLLPVMTAYVEKLISKGNFSMVDHLMEKIDDIYAPFFPRYFFFYFLKALIYEKKGDRQAALEYFERTADQLNRYVSSFHSIGFNSHQEEITHIYEKIIAFYLRIYDFTGKQIYIVKALYFSEMKNAIHNEPVTFKDRRYSNLKEEEKKLEQEFLSYHHRFASTLNDSHRKREVRFYKKKLDVLQKQYAELKEFIYTIPIRYRQYDFQDFNIRLIQKKLNPRQLVVKFCFLQDDLYIFFFNRHDLGYLCLQNRSPEVIRLVTALTEPLDDFTTGQVDYLRIHFDLKIAYQLYQSLLSGIIENNPEIEELLIISEKDLFKLPLEALVVGFNRKPLRPDIVFSEYRAANYLIERCAVSYYFSLFHLQKRFIQRKSTDLLISAFGNPPLPRNTRLNLNLRDNVLPIFRTIPSSRDEIIFIQELFGSKNCKIFLNRDFNRTNFETYAPMSEIVHIATHFIHNIAYPNQAALLMGAQEDQSPLYYAHEIFKLGLNANLVVLSCCESSEKSLLGLQGLVGMTAAFRNSGVRSMIVSLWPVDEFSSRLTPYFYREYLQDKDAVSALRRAKLKLMTQTASLKKNIKISFAHPFLWSNFILYRFYL